MTSVLPASGKCPAVLTGYVAVQVDMLRRLRDAAVDLFVQYDPAAPPMPYRRAGCAIDPEQLATLTDAGVQRIFIRTEDFESFGANLLEALESLSAHEHVPASERFAALQLALAVEIERTAKMIDCGSYLSLAEKVGRDLTALLASDDVLPLDLFRLARHDFNTFTHVTNVASYSIILSERLGTKDPAELQQIATGAMLHDIGKRFIPASILNKPARLDPAERAIIETHPQRGYEELCRRPGVTFEQLMMVYQHHERLNGKGYPVGVITEDIHPWARMLAVVDVFDAMTGVRPYRRPATAQEAMNYIKQHAGTQFDEEVVQCWNLAMIQN